jgi:glycosyltransferase involved in cell wall biosynthesis
VRVGARPRPAAAREPRLVAYTNAETVGGAEHCLATILAGLPQSFQVAVVATSPAVAEAVAAGLPAAEIVLVRPPTRFWDARAVGANMRALRRLDGDLCVINLHTPYSGLHATLAALLVRNLEVVAIEHLPLPSRSRAAHSLKRLTSRRLAAHVAVSEHTAAAIAGEARLRREAMLVIRNGVPEPASGVCELDLPRPIVGGMGRLDRQKGFDVLVDALADLPGVSAVVAGAGPERDALIRHARDRAVADRFAIVPWQDEVGPFLRSLDVFVLSSRYEGLPLALLEAMAAGVPIVAADVGAIGEAIVSGETGLLVSAGDPAALADAIRQLLDDEERRERLGMRAREAWRSLFTAERVQEEYVNLFTRLLR